MATNEAQTHLIAAGLAAASGLPVLDVKYPLTEEDWNTEDTAGPANPVGWTPPPGFWSVEHPPSKSPIVLRFENRDLVAGIVPGDGVWLHHDETPHSAGRITSISAKDGVIRVIVEELRPIGSK